MEVKCATSEKQSSGDGDSAVQKLRKTPFPGWLQGGICLLVILIGLLFVYRTFRPIPYPSELRMDVHLEAQNGISEAEKADIKLELSEALLTMEARATAAYNEKFATLLTILTIFGVAWPVIVGLLQFKFNENELRKIEKAGEDAKKSLRQANAAKEAAEKSLHQANAAKEAAEKSLRQANAAKEAAEKSLHQASEAQEKANEAHEKINSREAGLYRALTKVYYDLGRDRKETVPDDFGRFNHYFAVALEFRLMSLLCQPQSYMLDHIIPILDAFDVSQVNSPQNKSCRNNLRTCKTIAEQIIRKYEGTRWESEAQKTSDAVVNKYDQICGSPVEEETK